MLSYLRIRGLALIEDLTLELDPHLNILSGETGAGKSMIVDALTVLRGARVRPDIVRAGCDTAIVDAEFALEEETARHVERLLREHGLEPSEETGHLLLNRSVPRNGRGRVFINGQLTTREVLAELGTQLIDICSQHEHHSLTSTARHLELLDDFTGLSQELEQYTKEYSQVRELGRAIEQLESRSQSSLEQADFLRYQLAELERIAPEPGEYERLRARFGLLRESQRWLEFANLADQLLDSGEGAVRSRLGQLLELACRGQHDSPHLQAMTEALGVAESALEEVPVHLGRFVAELEVEPGELEAVERRLSELSTLRRKHGGELDDLSERVTTLKGQLAELENAEERLAALKKEHEVVERRAVEQAERLRASRRKSAKKLSSALGAELESLSLRGARFEARLEALGPEQLGPRGLDRAEFLFSANPGEPLMPLGRVASGGELSRLLLAFRGVVRSTGLTSTYVFDEVDAGVGGAVAERIGERLAHAAMTSQVLCITHLPQVAAFADAHLMVMKQTEQGRTTTLVRRLSSTEQEDELARMLGGARITASAREHARQLKSDAARTERGLRIGGARGAPKARRA